MQRKMARINFAKSTFGDFIAFIAYNIIGNYNALLRVNVWNDWIRYDILDSNVIILNGYDYPILCSK